MTQPGRPHFCLLCGTELVLRDDRGHPRPTCPACAWIYYRNPVPAAGVILPGPDGVLLVKRRWAPAAGAWCLPAGFMEYGETPEHCAVRELKEETGIEGRLTGLFGVYAGFDDPRVRAVLILFTATREGGRLRAGDDATETGWFRLDRLPKRIAFAAHRRALEEYRARVKRHARAAGREVGKRKK
jgi:8-oxo-dGTP diphosphatase